MLVIEEVLRMGKRFPAVVPSYAALFKVYIKIDIFAWRKVCGMLLFLGVRYNIGFL